MQVYRKESGVNKKAGLDGEQLAAIVENLKDMVRATKQATTAAKGLSKALASFDEVDVLKMPSVKAEKQSTVSVSNIVSDAIKSIGEAVQMAVGMNGLLRILQKIPTAMENISASVRRNANTFTTQQSVLQKNIVATERTKAATDSAAMAVRSLETAWTRVNYAMDQWQHKTVTATETEKIADFFSGITAMTSAVRGLGSAFTECTRTSNSALTAIRNGWGNISDWFRTQVGNPLIRDVNTLLANVANGFNQVFARGTVLGMNTTPISVPRIPQLAKGAVLPANKPFLAVVGDQKNGTNVEAPLDTIKQAVAEVVGNRDVVIRFTGDLAQLARVLRPVIQREDARIGGGLVKNEVW